MSRDRTPKDLRERMERVAARSRPPAAKPRARAPRSVPLVAAEEAATAESRNEAVVLPIPRERGRRRRAVPAEQESSPRARRAAEAPEPVPEQRSRLEALIAWGIWELTEVPARRWHWLKAVIRGGEPPLS